MWVERNLETPIGPILLQADATGVCALRLNSPGDRWDASPLLDRAQAELEEYFAGRRRAFSVPLSMHGTAFQMQVWRALMEIPYGKTATYGALARRIGRERACRAVGMANHVNPLPILVPCHRVVGANGQLTGYAGGLEMKKFLLELEERYAEI